MYDVYIMLVYDVIFISTWDKVIILYPPQKVTESKRGSLYPWPEIQISGSAGPLRKKKKDARVPELFGHRCPRLPPPLK